MRGRVTTHQEEHMHEFELAEQSAELLPQREATGLVDVTNAVGVNVGVAVSIGGDAAAILDQGVSAK